MGCSHFEGAGQVNGLVSHFRRKRKRLTPHYLNDWRILDTYTRGCVPLGARGDRIGLMANANPAPSAPAVTGSMPINGPTHEPAPPAARTFPYSPAI